MRLLHDSSDEPSTPHLDISVVIPAYQCEAYVAEAIHSVLSQDLQPTEIIVVDDGSTDRTAAVASAISPLVTVMSKPNGGEASARNAGLRKASAEWVAYLDADDRFLRGRLSAIARRVGTEPDLDLVTADGFLEVAGDIVGTCYGPQWPFPSNHHREEILRRNFVLGHVVARRRRLLDLGGFDETISHTTDWDMWIRLLRDGGKVGFVDERLSIYRLHGTSLSADPLAMTQGALATMEKAVCDSALTATEREIAIATISDQQVLIAREEITAALESGETSAARSAARLVATDRRQPTRRRARAVVTAIAPRVASAVQRRRRGDRRVGATGRLVPATLPPSESTTAERDRPLVSVILPFLDELRYLDGAIATVVEQTMGTWELLLVDDGSTDGSGAIADAAAERLGQRVVVMRHPQAANRGLAASRNLGLAEASGGAIAFLDADDRWEPGKLAHQLHLLAQHPAVAMVAGPTWHQVEGSSAPPVQWEVSTRAPGVFQPGAFVRELARETVIMPPPPSAVMYRTALLRDVGGVPAGDSLYEDQRTFATINLRYPVYFDDQAVSTYLKRSDSLFGSLQNDPGKKAAQRRTFEWWLVRRSLHSGSTGFSTLAALGAHRLTSAARRRLPTLTSLIRQRTESDTSSG